MPLGAIFGSVMSGALSSKIGRKKSLIIADIIGLVSCGIFMI